MKKTWFKFVLWTTVVWGIIKGLNYPAGIKLAFSSANEFIAASFGLIIMGLITGSIIFSIWRASAGRNKKQSVDTKKGS